MTTGLLTATLDDPAATPPGPGNPLPDPGVEFGDTLGGLTEREYFLHLDIDGGIWLRLAAFRFGAGAESDGSPFASSAQATFGLSSLDPKILAALGSGEVLETAQIEGYSLVGGVPRLVEEYRLGDVVIDDFSSTAGTGTIVNQHLTFSYNRIQHGIVNYDENGTVESQSAFGWDFALGREIKPRSMIEEAPLAEPELIQGDRAELSWFLRLGATGDWIQLHEVSFGTVSPDGAEGRAAPAPLQITFASNKLGPDLLEALTSGARYGRLELEAYKDGPEPFLVAEHRFGLAEVTGLTTFGPSFVHQGVSFSYDTITSARFTQDETGQAILDGPIGFDFRTGEAVTSEYVVKADVPLEAPDTIGGAPLQLQYFMEIEGFGVWVELSHFRFVLERESSAPGAGGQPSSRAVAGPIEVEFGTHSLSPALFGKLVNGEGIASVEMEIYAAGGGTPLLVDEYEFGNVQLARTDTTGGLFGFQSLQMSFETIEHAHVTYGTDGQPIDVNRKGFDFSTNTALAADAGELLF